MAPHLIGEILLTTPAKPLRYQRGERKFFYSRANPTLTQLQRLLSGCRAGTVPADRPSVATIAASVLALQKRAITAVVRRILWAHALHRAALGRSR